MSYDTGKLGGVGSRPGAFVLAHLAASRHGKVYSAGKHLVQLIIREQVNRSILDRLEKKRLRELTNKVSMNLLEREISQVIYDQESRRSASIATYSVLLAEL